MGRIVWNSLVLLEERMVRIHEVLVRVSKKLEWFMQVGVEKSQAQKWRDTQWGKRKKEMGSARGLG